MENVKATWRTGLDRMPWLGLEGLTTLDGVVMMDSCSEENRPF